MQARCTTCDWHPAAVKGECRTCYMWRRNHNGQRRPESAIVAYGQRIADRIIEADLRVA